MAGGFSATHADLVQAAKDLENGNAQLQSELSQLGNAVSGVVGSWEGTAASAFHNLMEAFNRDAKQLNDSLLAISEAVAGTAKDYDAREQEAQSSISTITSTLG